MVTWVDMQAVRPAVSEELLALTDRLGQAWIGYCDQPDQIRIVTSGPVQEDGSFAQLFTHVYYRYFTRWTGLGITR